MWVIILITSIPAYHGHDVVYYMHDGINKSSCVFFDMSSTLLFSYQLEFFLKAYVVPLCLTAGLYLLMILRLWRGVVPGGRLSAESRRGKKRVTRMVVVVVAIFALCWAPIQVRKQVLAEALVLHTQKRVLSKTKIRHMLYLLYFTLRSQDV